jgi:hypothetical protein
MKKRPYIKPEVTKVAIDNLFSLQASSMDPPMDPMVRTDGTKGTDTPFSSPFDDRPFS